MKLQEYVNELTDISSKKDYLKFELYNSIQEGDMTMVTHYYNMISEAEQLIGQLNDTIKKFSSLN